MSFVRDEHKYLAVKTEDAHNALTESQLDELSRLLNIVRKYRKDSNKAPLKLVCVADTDPLYNHVWDLIETYHCHRSAEIENFPPHSIPSELLVELATQFGTISFQAYGQSVDSETRTVISQYSLRAPSPQYGVNLFDPVKFQQYRGKAIQQISFKVRYNPTATGINIIQCNPCIASIPYDSIVRLNLTLESFINAWQNPTNDRSDIKMIGYNVEFNDDKSITIQIKCKTSNGDIMTYDCDAIQLENHNSLLFECTAEFIIDVYAQTGVDLWPSIDVWP